MKRFISHAEVEAVLRSMPKGQRRLYLDTHIARLSFRTWSIAGSDPLTLLPAIDRLTAALAPIEEVSPC